MAEERRRGDAVSEPLDVSRVGDEVAVTGPGRAAFSLTRDAALKSARRLFEAANTENDGKDDAEDGTASG